MARIASPEALFPDENQERMTASVMYNRPFHAGNWASTLLWGRTRSLLDQAIFDSYLLESTVRFAHAKPCVDAHRERGAIERTDPRRKSVACRILRSNRSGACKPTRSGYDRDVDLIPHLASAIGVQATSYGVPDLLQPIYGMRPAGVAVFLRLRPN